MADTFLKIDNVDGEALDEKHSNWIEVLSFGHDMMQQVSNTRSTAGGAATGRTQHGDFEITKYVDKSSPKLYEAVSTGKHLGNVKLEVCRAGGGQVKFLEIKMEEVMISSVRLNSNGHGGGEDQLPTETVHLNYGKIEWIYTQQKRKDGAGGGQVTAKYDLTIGKA